MADDLVSRLSETLDELERVAQFGGPAPWRRYLEGADDGWAIESTDAEVSFIVGDEDVATHVARWDPKAVLGLVAAVREIIKAYEGALIQQQRRPNNAENNGYVLGISRAVHELLVGFGLTEEDDDRQPRWASLLTELRGISEED